MSGARLLIQRLIIRIEGLRLARRHSEAGASLVEYALLVALIAVVCVAAVAFFGNETSDTFSRVGRSMDGV